MRLLANENIPSPVIVSLRGIGHDVHAIAERTPGATDEQVLKIASTEQRVIMTFDRDYGELVYLRGLPVPPAIVFLRFVPRSPSEASLILRTLFSNHEESVLGHFVVVSRDRYRRRPLPEG